VDDFESFVMYISLATLGFTSVLVNYSGSSGYGQECILELVGRVGELDVDQGTF
jgi:dipeptidyl aminopeptidase/acylaminoacyl peptidase